MLLLVAMAASIAGVTAAGVVDGRLSIWIVVLNALLGVLLPAWLLLGTDYVLDQEQLKVRCGPFRWTIPVKEIRQVEPTLNPLSSPALSLDRLRIEYGSGKSLMISPRDAEQFLKDLDALRQKR